MLLLGELIVFTLCTAALGHFVQLCLKPGMVFSRYGLWLEYVYRHSWRRKDKWKRWVVKPIGLCVYCTTHWLYTFAFIAYYWPLTYYDVLLLLLGSGTNYIWIELLAKVK